MLLAPSKRRSSPDNTAHTQQDGQTDMRPHKMQKLVVDTAAPPLESAPSPNSDHDSLFDDTASLNGQASHAYSLATRTSPPIPGFFFTPTLRLPSDLANSVVSHCLDTYFTAPHINQIMLFCRAATPESPSTRLPPVFSSLLDTLSALLLPPILPLDIHNLLFPSSTTLARQAIINKYEPGEGITAHVDLLKRFGDGIVGVSFASGCVMQFASVDANEEEMQRTHALYLPERSVIVLSGDARYKWTHGIDKRGGDYVAMENSPDGGGQWLERSMRISITFRWLLPGADASS